MLLQLQWPTAPAPAPWGVICISTGCRAPETRNCRFVVPCQPLFFVPECIQVKHFATIGGRSESNRAKPPDEGRFVLVVLGGWSLGLGLRSNCMVIVRAPAARLLAQSGHFSSGWLTRSNVSSSPRATRFIRGNARVPPRFARIVFVLDLGP